MRTLADQLASSYHSINAILICLNVAYLNVLIYAKTQKVMWLYCFIKVSKGAKIRNRYNQVPHQNYKPNLKIMGFPICGSFISGKMPGNPLPRESVTFER